MANISLALSTKVAEATKFTVDGEEYEILGVDHLSAEDEAEALALFARHGLIAEELELTRNVQKGTQVALNLKACRVQILCKLTTLPKDVAGKLPIHAQIKLLAAVQEEIAGPEDGSAPETPSSGEDD